MQVPLPHVPQSPAQPAGSGPQARPSQALAQLGHSPHVAPGGVLVFHDVFEDPAEGGQAPFLVWQAAVRSGRFTPLSTTGSLRVLRRDYDERATS